MKKIGLKKKRGHYYQRGGNPNYVNLKNLSKQLVVNRRKNIHIAKEKRRRLYY